MLITDELARRLEYAEAVDAAGCVDAACRLDPECEASAKAVGGGYLTFCGAESPLTHAIGVGMHGPVTVADVDEIEAFFRSRGAPVAVDVCPHADPSLRDILSQRGYRMMDFSNVLVRPIAAGEQIAAVEDGPEVRPGQPDEMDLYAQTVVRGFFGRETMTEEELQLGRLLFRMPCTTGYLAFVAGEAVGAGGLSIRNRVASFFGDATLRAARGRRVQSALIAERLRAAVEAGCDVAAAGTQPGSVSQRNYQRFGFAVAYSKVTMVLGG
jgi:hypothetical protein